MALKKEPSPDDLAMIASLDLINRIEVYADAVAATKVHRSPENTSMLLYQETETLAACLRFNEARKNTRRKRGKK